MEFAEAEILCIVDYYGVDIRHIDAALHDGGGKKHIVLMVGKILNRFLEFLGCHLSVAHHHTRIGHEPAYHCFKFVQSLDAVVDHKHLAVARQFEVDGLGDEVVAQRAHIGDYRVAVGRWSGDGRKIAGTHQ